VRCGHRPYVSDGVLLLGRVPFYANLLVSCGPGSNGWKLAMGSGEIVERLVSGKTEDDISKALGFDAHTFSPAGRVKQAPFFSKLCLARWGVKDIDEKEDAVMKESS
jgi:glycine/D-amino acid oxidase-like deaminating enzyme